MLLCAVVLIFIMVSLYALGMGKPIDRQKVEQIEKIMMTIET